MVIEHSFMNKSYTAKIYIYIYIYLCVLPNIVYGFRRKIEQLKTAVSFENFAGSISCEDDTEITSPFHLNTLTL